MEIQALKWLAKPQGCVCLRSTLPAASAEALLAAKTLDQPAAFVIRSPDLALLRSLTDIVTDRKTKHEKKPLAAYLLRRDKIPLIDGNYRDPGQLARGVRTLLAAARRQGDRNIYVIGVGAPTFETLWATAGEPGRTGEASTESQSFKPWPRSGTSATGGFVSARELLRILGEEPEPESLVHDYVGDSDEVRLVRQLILRAAQKDCRVLILGPTGTGKEKVARAIHRHSSRAKGPLIAVNCSAIPASLFETEMFGIHAKIATGVEARIGLWEAAKNGTLFLDEIGDLSEDNQAKILRVLDDNMIRRIGGRGDGIKVDVRVIAATNMDLYAMVKAGQFREDLYFRLCELQMRTPALSEHRADIPAIARFLWKHSVLKDQTAVLSKAVEAELRDMPWPGNVRELKAVLASLYAVSKTKNPDLNILRTVVLLRQHAATGPTDHSASQRPRISKIERLSHMRRLEELLGTCEMALRSTLKDQAPHRQDVVILQDRVRLALGELEVLCLHPLLFSDEPTFSAVHQFKGRLAFFHGLLQSDRQAAMRLLRQGLADEAKRLLAALEQRTRTMVSSS